jgi:imidazolonepropionase-like amidohydrolase
MRGSRTLAALALATTMALAGGAFAQARRAPAKPAAAKPAAPAQVLAIVGATALTGAGAPIQDATVIVTDGKITEIKKGAAVPSGALSIDAKGQVVTAGLVDGLTSVGLVEIDLEPSARDDQKGGDAIRAAFRASDGYNPASTVIRVTRLEGVTSVGVLPSGGLVSGQSAWADLDGARATDALVKAPLALHVRLGGAGSTDTSAHATAILRLREAFDDARTYERTRAAWERNQSRPFSVSRLDLDALVLALQGKVPVVFHTDRAADILSALALAKELGLRPVIAGGAEAWRVRDALAAAKVPVFVRPLIAGPESFDAIGARGDNAALLAAAGVPVAITSGETHNARKLRQIAGNAVRAGLPHDAGVAAITRAPAEALGMGASYGTLEPGKVANLVVWSGDPLEVTTRPVAVVIHGRVVPLESRQTALYEKYKPVAAENR